MKVQSELAIFERVNDRLSRVERDLAKARKCRDQYDGCADSWTRTLLEDSMGRSLQNIYCGIEGIHHDFMLEIDGEMPNSPRFHTGLLDRTTRPLSL